jgi:ribosomal protein S18 acetylase RimI-like enzyme
MPESPVIRSASIEDVDTLVVLMDEFYREGGYVLPHDNARRVFRELLADPALGGIWLIEHRGTAAGHVVLTLAFSMEYGGLRGFIDDLFVRPAYRRQGFARHALAAVLHACRQRGVRAVLVETSVSNEAAVRAYAQAGFRDTGRLLMAVPLATATHEQD